MQIIKKINAQYIEKWHWVNGYQKVMMMDGYIPTYYINIMRIKEIKSCKFEYCEDKTRGWVEHYKGCIIVMDDDSGYIMACSEDEAMKLLNK